MQQRIVVPIAIVGVLMIAVIGFMFFGPSDTKVNNTVIQVSDDVKSEADGAGVDGAPESKPTTDEIIIPAPVLKDNAPQAEVEEAVQADASDISLSAEEVDLEPRFAITVARVEPDGSAIFAGVAEAEASIQLIDGNVLIDTTVADAGGEWVSVPSANLSPGPHLIILTMKTVDGRTVTSSLSLVVEIAEGKTEKPFVALVPQDDTSAPVLLQSPDPEDSIEIVEQDIADIEVRGILPSVSIEALSLVSTGQLRVSGAHNAGKFLRGTLGGIALLEPVVSEDGSWSALADISGLSEASQVLDIKLLDGAAKVIATASLSLDRNNLSSGLANGDMVVVQKGDALWKIAYRTFGKGVRYVEIVRRNQDQISDPNLIYPNQIFVIPK